MTIEHPISIYYRKTGKSFDEAVAHVKEYYAESENMNWSQCQILSHALYGANFIYNPAMVGFGIGEIGLAYVAYRLQPYVERRDVLMYFRNGNFDSLNALLNAGLQSMKNFGLTQDTYVATHIDGELMGLLTEYTAVPNSLVLDLIRDAGLDERLRRWSWSPTRASYFLRAGIVNKFHYGIQIINGETGHTALSFKSTLWSDGIEGFVYGFDLPMQIDIGYARHLPSKKLAKVMASIKAVMKENRLAEAFEHFTTAPGIWGSKRLIARLATVKARDASKEKLSVSFADEIAINKPRYAIDAVTSMMECASRINKSAALAAQLAISEVITDVLALPKTIKGEVVVA